jgi:hypothetical protein
VGIIRCCTNEGNSHKTFPVFTKVVDLDAIPYLLKITKDFTADIGDFSHIFVEYLPLLY